jgi:hypothetical protein
VHGYDWTHSSRFITTFLSENWQLPMKFQPIRAATIFSLAVSLPLLLATSVILSWPRIVIAAAAVGAAATWALFFLGAKAARRPHTPKSIIFADLLTWVFTYSTSGMATHFAPNGGPWLDVSLFGVSLAFIFLAGWRFAPRTVAAVHG